MMDANAKAFSINCRLCNGFKKTVGTQQNKVTYFRFVRYRMCDWCDYPNKIKRS